MCVSIRRLWVVLVLIVGACGVYTAEADIPLTTKTVHREPLYYFKVINEILNNGALSNEQKKGQLQQLALQIIDEIGKESIEYTVVQLKLVQLG